MADTITSSRELKLNSTYADGDTRAITLKNPRQNVTAAEINAVGSYFLENNVLIGDKAGADFASISEAEIVEKTRRDIDIA